MFQGRLDVYPNELSLQLKPLLYPTKRSFRVVYCFQPVHRYSINISRFLLNNLHKVMLLLFDLYQICNTAESLNNACLLGKRGLKDQ